MTSPSVSWLDTHLPKWHALAAFICSQYLSTFITGIVGDITPVCGVSDAEKFALESAALGQLKATLGDCMAAEEMEALWHEYEKGETQEAKLVKDFDKVGRGGAAPGRQKNTL